MTSLDVLYIALAFGFLTLVIFVSIAAFRLAEVLRELRPVVKDLKPLVENVDSIAQDLKQLSSGIKSTVESVATLIKLFSGKKKGS